ncbi:hypothetical protein [Aerococcus mictus]
MIKTLTQTTEYYCSTKEEANQVIEERKKELSKVIGDRRLGELVKQTIEAKTSSDYEYTKLTLKEEYNLPLDLAKNDPKDDVHPDNVELFPIEGEANV